MLSSYYLCDGFVFFLGVTFGFALVTLVYARGSDPWFCSCDE